MLTIILSILFIWKIGLIGLYQQACLMDADCPLWEQCVYMQLCFYHSTASWSCFSVSVSYPGTKPRRTFVTTFCLSVLSWLTHIANHLLLQTCFVAVVKPRHAFTECPYLTEVSFSSVYSALANNNATKCHQQDCMCGFYLNTCTGSMCWHQTLSVVLQCVQWDFMSQGAAL